MKWILLALLIGCSKGDEWSTTPYQKCLDHETYTYTTMILVGKVFMPQVRTGSRCSLYSHDFYMSHGGEVFILQLTK